MSNRIAVSLSRRPILLQKFLDRYGSLYSSCSFGANGVSEDGILQKLLAMNRSLFYSGDEFEHQFALLASYYFSRSNSKNSSSSSIASIRFRFPRRRRRVHVAGGGSSRAAGAPAVGAHSFRRRRRRHREAALATGRSELAAASAAAAHEAGAAARGRRGAARPHHTLPARFFRSDRRRGRAAAAERGARVGDARDARRQRAALVLGVRVPRGAALRGAGAVARAPAVAAQLGLWRSARTHRTDRRRGLVSLVAETGGHESHREPLPTRYMHIVFIM